MYIHIKKKAINNLLNKNQTKDNIKKLIQVIEANVFCLFMFQMN